ncbi:hypothetical protein BCV70DRAFT_197732 [Testicularia cyperi]|uniref:Uncharacterized protein n=1 Tax=Testicularia cyperi TaxID=1882483 RepID=A0A317Y0D3_9BASI|nr:hypothetical protein BCV70DRAFT_197732 [Testicularia cyperi]
MGRPRSRNSELQIEGDTLQSVNRLQYLCSRDETVLYYCCKTIRVGLHDFTEQL